jgi:cytoplasmic iron level regulating protein YaaA (DUF328/UPF0246 family)
MLIVVSPAKRLNENPEAKFPLSEPLFQAQAEELAKRARRMSMAEIGKLMKISAPLSKLNHARYRDFGKMPRGAAALMFDGDTYAGLEAKSLDGDEMDWAVQHLRILSGMYGLLRPTDAIEPHRLEMGTRLTTRRGKSLYDYWGSRIAEALNQQAGEVGAKVLVNCASEEYFAAVDREALKLRVVTPVFMEAKPEGPKIVGFFAKKARGAMARYIIERRLDDVEALRSFDSGGYRFQSDMSDADRLVFLREDQMAQAG